MIYKCNDCGKSVTWSTEHKKIICSCGSDNYKKVDNTSELTCDICGSRLNTNNIVQFCDNCGSYVVNTNNTDFSGISVAKIKESEIKGLIDKHISKFQFSKDYKKLQYQLMYLPYWFIDGKCQVVSDTESFSATYINYPVYAGKNNNIDYNNIDFKHDMQDIQKFEYEYLFGAITCDYDKREQVITRTILNGIMNDIKNKLRSKSIDINSADIRFEPTGKMLVMLPLYKVDLGSYILYVNAQTGDVFGGVPKSKRRILIHKLLKYTSLAFIVFTALFMGGVFQL